MYAHWVHHYLPKLFAILSYIFNPLFIYLILTDPNSSKIGKYRFLLLFFACFDITYTTVELIIPMGVHGSGAAFMGYLAGGPFFENEKYGQLALSFRTCFVALSYGILMSHFIYRYIVLYRPRLIETLLKPLGMVCILLFVLLHGAFWMFITEFFLYGNDEVRTYVHEYFLERHNEDSFKMSILCGMYHDASPALIRRSWIAIILLTFISFYAIFFYIFFGHKIMQKLIEHQALSTQTANLHKQLLKALAVQTFIPIVISFVPCCSEQYGQFALSIRTSFVALSYGVLMIHFLYRYLILHKPSLIDKLLKPFGILCIFIFVLLHGLAWCLTVELFLYQDDELHGYVHEDFQKSYSMDSFKTPMLGGIYYNATFPMIRRTWTGVFFVTCISVYAILSYCFLGSKIMKKLKAHRVLSIRTADLHKQLFKALAVQTFIPIFISFTPCCIAWYSPMFGINVGTWNNFFGAIALSAFPAFDPLAIVCLLPNYRNRVLNMIPVRKVRKVAHLMHSDSISNMPKVRISSERLQM